MKQLKILLVCGSGASSGFMAANMRKAAAKRGLEVDIAARSESAVESYVSEVDAVMLGPHLSYLMEEMEERVAGTDAKVILMKKEYYSTLDGEAALQDLLDTISRRRL